MPVFNKWANRVRGEWLGDPDVVAFNAAVQTAANEYAKVASSATGAGVTSDAARREVTAMLNTAQTPAQFNAVCDLIQKELRNRSEGYDKQIEAVGNQINRLFLDGQVISSGGAYNLPAQSGARRPTQPVAAKPGRIKVNPAQFKPEGGW